jgi:hypothetical protein
VKKSNLNKITAQRTFYLLYVHHHEQHPPHLLYHTIQKHTQEGGQINTGRNVHVSIISLKINFTLVDTYGIMKITYLSYKLFRNFNSLEISILCLFPSSCVSVYVFVVWGVHGCDNIFPFTTTTLFSTSDYHFR